MKWRNLLLGFIIGAASLAYSEAPYLPVTVNFELASPQFEIKTKALNTPTIRCYPYQGTNLYDATGYRAHLSWGKDSYDSSMVSVTGVVGSSYIDFNLASNDLAYAISRWYCAVMLTKPADGSVYSIAYGYMTVLPAPEVSSTAILQKTYAINGSEYGPFTGSFTGWPFALSGDYAGYVEISKWNSTNAAFSALFGLQGSTNAYYQGLFDDLFASNALKTDIATFAAATNLLHTQKVDKVTFNASDTVFSGWHSAQADTNTAFDARIADVEAAVELRNH